MITLLYVITATIAVTLYLLPTILALFTCEERHASAIIIINIFLGWMILPWFAALIYAILAPRRTP